MKRALLAVDGGGTKTEFILADEFGNVLFDKTYGSSNLNINIENAFMELAVGTREFMAFAKTNGYEVAGSFFGLSGGVNGENQELVYNFFKPRYFENIPFSNDGDELNAMRTGVKFAPNGIAVIGGTGSNISLKKDGELLPNPQLCGWGHYFDKSVSGYDFGRSAIIAAKNEINGMGPKTLIKPLVEEKLQGDVFSSLKKIYDQGPGYIASFGPTVFTAYKEGDAVAEQIIKDHTSSLCELINAAHDKIDSSVPAVVGLVGGVFKHNADALLPFIEGNIHENLEITIPEETQIFGALMEAANNAGVDVNQDFIDNYNNTYSAAISPSINVPSQSA